MAIVTGPDTADAATGPRPPEGLRLGPVTSRSDLVAATLRDMIVAGRFRPGETLVERQIAAMLGVSKTPVREALIALASSGLVEVSRNRGVVVRRPAARDMWTVFELRLLLEPWAIGRSTELRAEPTAREAGQVLHETAGLLDAEDRTELNRVNRRFHRALYAGCDNDLVVAQLDRSQDVVAVGLLLLWERTSWPVWRAEHDEHVGMLEAVRAGDAGLATRRTHEHIERVMRQFRDHLPALG